MILKLKKINKEGVYFGMTNQMTIRRAARTVIFDKISDKIAILEVKNGSYYKIPGGGVEDKESSKETAIREAIEEGACDVEIIAELGEIEFKSPEYGGQINHSVCFLARKIKDRKTTEFTKEEQRNKFKLLWVDFNEAIDLFKNVKSKIPFELNMNNRDLRFIQLAKEYLSKN